MANAATFMNQKLRPGGAPNKGSLAEPLPIGQLRALPTHLVAESERHSPGPP
jgi:hypothetical protein